MVRVSGATIGILRQFYMQQIPYSSVAMLLKLSRAWLFLQKLVFLAEKWRELVKRRRHATKTIAPARR